MPSTDAPEATDLAAVVRLLADIRVAIGGRPGDSAFLIGRTELYRRLDVSVPTGDRMAAAGKVGPKPVLAGGKKYHAAEVAAWLATPRSDGQLHDAKTWPAVWKQMHSSK